MGKVRLRSKRTLDLRMVSILLSVQRKLGRIWGFHPLSRERGDDVVSLAPGRLDSLTVEELRRIHRQIETKVLIFPSRASSPTQEDDSCLEIGRRGSSEPRE